MSNLSKLFERIIPAPDDWFTDLKPSSSGDTLEPLPCESYEELVAVWKRAMTWNERLDIALSTMLAVVASTKLQGDQVWLRLLGIPGTAKTTLCEAFSTNKQYCKAVSMLTGIHSGYKDGSGKDFSLVERFNGFTVLLNEGDMLLKAPNRDAIMAQLRDLYSGVTRNDYRHKEAEAYEGLRTTFILAGTPKLRMLNSSALGDRFLDCKIYERESEEEESELVRNVLRSTRRRVVSESNCDPRAHDSSDKIEAKQRTAGFINYLRETVIDRLNHMINSSQEELLDRIDNDCEKLGRLVAYMRTRLGSDEEPTEKELHIRLSEQLRKTGYCLSIVLNRPLDSEVMRRVALTAEETCYGNPFKVIKTLSSSKKPLDLRGLSLGLRKNDEVVRKAVTVLRELDLIRADTAKAASGAIGRGKTIYRLSPKTIGLMSKLKSLLAG